MQCFIFTICANDISLISIKPCMCLSSMPPVKHHHPWLVSHASVFMCFPCTAVLLFFKRKAARGMQAEASLTQVGESDRVTNDQSLLSQHCDIFLNMAQTVRCKTKLVLGIFSWPLSEHCHLCQMSAMRCVCSAMWTCVRRYAHALIHINIIHIAVSSENESVHVYLLLKALYK